MISKHRHTLLGVPTSFVVAKSTRAAENASVLLSANKGGMIGGHWPPLLNFCGGIAADILVGSLIGVPYLNRIADMIRGCRNRACYRLQPLRNQSKSSNHTKYII